MPIHEALKSIGIFQREQRGTQVIEPAIGERRRLLENDCHEMLQATERWFLAEDFTRFTSNMIELLGGTIEERGRKETIKYSNVLADHQNGVSITFHRQASYKCDHEEYAAISVNGSQVFEKLEQTMPRKKLSREQDAELMIERATISAEVHLVPSPLYDSYISDKPEKIFPDGIVAYQRDLDSPDEGKQFCQRVYNVYQQVRKGTS